MPLRNKMYSPKSYSKSYNSVNGMPKGKIKKSMLNDLKKFIKALKTKSGYEKMNTHC
jgi:hypothetical protein